MPYQVAVPKGSAPPLAPYSPGTKAGNALYVSGTLALDSAGILVGKGGPSKRACPASTDWTPPRVDPTAGEWTLDELLVNERFVAVHLANKGLFVFTACSHAGLINVLTHAAERFPGIPLFGVLGGFHLAGPTEAIIPETIDALEAFDLQLIAAAHCTGWRALGQLAQRFGDRVVPSAVGKRFVL